MAGRYGRDYRGDDRWRRDERWPDAERGSDYGRGGDWSQTSQGYRDRDYSGSGSQYGQGREPGGRSDYWRGDDYGREGYGRGDYGRTPAERWRERGVDERGYGDYYAGYPYFGGGGAWEAGMGMPGSYGGLFGPDYGAGRDRYYADRYGNRGRYDRYGSGSYRDRGSERGFWDRASDEVASWFGDEAAERRREQDQHRGRGPKGYTRSDDRIREDVSDRLTDDGFVDASDIEVNVSGAEVTLTGTVGSREQRRRAEDCAERVSGVTHVQNNLRVKSPESTSASGVSSSIAYGEAPGDQAGKTGRSATSR